ncbi:MAG: phosphatidylserine decarboxylase, partial [Deltaproteobacteria bacterium]|nr:phosphatidylserine decarboxylase [Deltaproteobacteria bacterium]
MNIRGRALYYFFDMFSGNGFSRFVGRASDVRLPAPLNRTLFSLYSRIFGVDVAEIEKPLSEYENFNNFFTRKLKDGARAMDSREDVLISPCDGNVQEFGRMEKGRLLQVKGKSYGVDELLMDAEESKRFQNGCFA